MYQTSWFIMNMNELTLDFIHTPPSKMYVHRFTNLMGLEGYHICIVAVSKDNAVVERLEVHVYSDGYG